MKKTIKNRINSEGFKQSNLKPRSEKEIKADLMKLTNSENKKKI